MPGLYPDHLTPDVPSQLREDVEFFQRWGYLVVDDAIDSPTIEALRTAIDGADERSEEQFIPSLHEQDDAFVALLANPPVFRRMQALLGASVQLHSATGRVTQPGEKDQNWHRDVPWPVAPWGTPYGALPGQINCGYYLDEITEENGPIVIVPGSHRVPFRPPEGHARFPEEVRVLATPGQAVMFDGCLYHRGAANVSQERRRVALYCYQPAWMKSREPFDGPVATRLKEQGSDEMKLLMGAIERW